MTDRTLYRPTANDIAAYARAIAAALPGDWTMPDGQETHWAARIERADGLRLHLGFQTYGAKVGRLEVSASLLDTAPNGHPRTLGLTEGNVPTFAALGPNGQPPAACAAAIARRVLTPALDDAMRANIDQAAAKRQAADAFRAACRAEAEPWGDVLRITPNDDASRAEIRAKAPGFDLRAYCYSQGNGEQGLIYTDRGSLTMTWESLRAILRTLTA